MYVQLKYLFLSVLIIVPVGVFAQTVQNDWQTIGDETIDLFRQYLSINTANPPGDVSEAADFHRRILEKEGIDVEMLFTDADRGRVNVLARIKGSGSKRPVMLLNHMDTVPVDESGWTVDPFAGVMKDGYIYGRGALDMKNFGIVQLMTMVLLKRNKIELERDVIFASVADEETGGGLGARWISRNKWDEIDAEYVLDEGGFGTEGFFTNDDRLIFSVGVAEKRIVGVTLTTTGTEGHASMPSKDNANLILAVALARLADYQPPEKINPVVAEMIERLGGLDDTRYNNAISRNTFAVTVIRGYVGDPPKTNVIPGRAQANIDCRILPGEDPDDFVAELRKVIDDPRVEIRYGGGGTRLNYVSSFDTELFRTIERETKKIFPNSITLPQLIAYGTDSRLFRPLGAICYGFYPGQVTMEEYGRIHGNDERIRIESIRNAVQIYYNVIMEFCKAK